MTKRKSTPTDETQPLQIEESQTEEPQAEETQADEIQVEATTFSEVILGNATAEPLPQTWTRVDCE